MATNVHQMDIEQVLAHMPTPLVVLQVGTGEVIYANHAAKRLDFAYTEQGWTAADEKGLPIEVEALPHRAARRGECFDGRLVHFRNGDTHHALRFHCHRLQAGACVLTFDEVTELDRSQQDLRAALRARDELVSLAAHELRSPLGALQLVAERIRRRMEDTVPGEVAAEVTRMTATALRQTRRLSVLVSNLLDVSRIRAGMFELDLEPASLADLIEEACEPFVEHAAIDGKQLRLEIGDRAVGQWDRVRIEQLVVNLLTNALKYGASPIIVRLERRDGHVELAVIDHGAGITEDAQARVFEPFERATSRHTAKSLGLGLFIVREIVAAHGGSIALDSRAGYTAFKINLPVKP